MGCGKVGAFCDQCRAVGSQQSPGNVCKLLQLLFGQSKGGPWYKLCCSCCLQCAIRNSTFGGCAYNFFRFTCGSMTKFWRTCLWTCHWPLGKNHLGRRFVLQFVCSMSQFCTKYWSSYTSTLSWWHQYFMVALPSACMHVSCEHGLSPAGQCSSHCTTWENGWETETSWATDLWGSHTATAKSEENPQGGCYVGVVVFKCV